MGAADYRCDRLRAATNDGHRGTDPNRAELAWNLCRRQALNEKVADAALYRPIERGQVSACRRVEFNLQGQDRPGPFAGERPSCRP